MKLKAAFFDLDGTLVNTLSDLAEATNYALDKYGFESRPAENFAQYAGSGVYTMIERALKPKTVSNEVLKAIRNEFFDYYEKHSADNSSPYCGISQLISKLRGEGIRLACITNKVDKIAKDIIEHYFGEFDAVFGQIDNLPQKPNPHFVLKALKELGLKAEECAFIGDSDVDMQTAKNSGCVAVGVLWGFRSEAELRKSGADYIVSSPCEIEEIFNSNE